MFSGLNVPNKKPGEPLLEWAGLLLQELPGCDLCLHYSLKHQRCSGDPAAVFDRFCFCAAEAGVARVLLVTGPSGPAFDTVTVLERLAGQHPAPGRLKLGVAFNACLPTEAARLAERERLMRKLRTGLIEEVWLNCGSDPALLGAGAAFAQRAAEDAGARAVKLFGSVLLPNAAQLQQFRERPWNGVRFNEEYLESIDGMARVTGQVLATYRASGIEPIVESKVRGDDDLQKLADLLAGKWGGVDVAVGALDEKTHPDADREPCGKGRSKRGTTRRWGPRVVAGAVEAEMEHLQCFDSGWKGLRK